MKKILLVFCCFVFLVANAQEDLPSSTIHFVYSGSFIGSECTTAIGFPNQQEVVFSLGSLLNYKVYSEGEISITITIRRAGTKYFKPLTLTQQLQIKVERGADYYVTYVVAGKNRGFQIVTKEAVQALLDESKNIVIWEEDLDSPINRNSVRGFTKKGVKGQGTCFAISPNGYLVTNYHCIENAKEITVKGIDGDLTTKYGATVVASDPSNDLAILKIGNKNVKFNTLSFGFRSSGVAQAEKVYALGFPAAAAMGTEVKITEGIISAKSGVNGDISKFQISAAVNPGNSGGPLIDEQGNLIGVIFAKSTIAESAGYAIKASYLETFLKNVEGFEFPTFVNSMKDKPFTEKVADWKNYIFIVETN